MTVDFASTIFGNIGVYVLADFFKDAEDNYATKLRAVDFLNNPEEARSHINLFVSNVTRRKIPQLLDQPPSPETVLMLVNAIYFNGNWEVPFETEFTKDRPFFVSPTETLQV